VTTRELIDRGDLIEPMVFAPPIDLSGVRVRRGEYDMPEVARRMDKLVGSITATWMQRGAGKRTAVFAVNVDHSRRIVDAFRALGVRADHLDYKMAHRPRAEILRRLRDGQIDMVSQVMLLSEGWDLPALQCAVLARPTKSLALFRQMVGRVMRPPGPVVVLDHAGNHHEHGPVTDEIQWTLDSRERAARTAEPLTTCPVCFAMFPPAAKFCPACGAPRPVRDEADPPGVDNPGGLVEFKSPRKATQQEKQLAYRALVQTASMRGYKLAWARIRYRETYGVWPRFRMIERSEYQCSEHEWEWKDIGPRRVQRCARCYGEADHVKT